MKMVKLFLDHGSLGSLPVQIKLTKAYLALMSKNTI